MKYLTKENNFENNICYVAHREDIRNMHQRIQFLHSKPQEKYDNFLGMQMV